MKILQVITDTDRRGAQVFATDLHAAIAASPNDVTTIALATGSQGGLKGVEAIGASRRSPRTIQQLRRAMRSADITIAHGSATAMACALAGGARRPFVYRQISDTRFWANTTLRRWRVGLYLRRAARVVALSEDARVDLVDHVGVPAQKISIVPNGVPAHAFRPPSDAERLTARASLGVGSEDFIALYVGALVPEKGVDTLIDAVGTLGSATVLVVGDGPGRPALERRAERQVPGRVRFVGALVNTVRAFHAADVVVLPSKGGDSMPASLIEAGYCSLPTISTPIGSIERIVISEVTGLIVAPNDAVELGRAIDRLQDSELRARLGRAARDHCLENFEIAVVADQWLAVLAAVLSKSGGAQTRLPRVR